jgi:hypothetical protein
MTMSIRRLSAALALCASLAAAHVSAAVTEADAQHLLLSYSLPVKAAPERAYAATVDVAKWWGSDHTYSGNAANLRLDARAGGCWCEKLAGGGVEHLHVVLAWPGRLLRLTGGLGPLQSGALNGTLTFEYKSGADGNSIAVTYLVAGHFGGGLDKVAAGVDHVLAEQLGRLQQFVDGALPPPAKKS